jgi:poly-gamma-glutamate synthesis protein (capsule biosynthesis protein)
MTAGVNTPVKEASRDERRAADAGLVTLFLCGDVMTGRGIDQVLPHPSGAEIHERYLGSASDYVKLAEQENGPIDRPVEFDYIWGDAVDEWRRVGPDVRIVNLETSVTTSNAWLPRGINYRMHPRNVPCLTEARIDCCVLANNHILDWSGAGLLETIETLGRAGLRTAGAGRNAREARAPAILEVADKGRVLVFAFGLTTSGIPSDWAASEDGPGVNLLPNLSEATVRSVADMVREVKRPRDIVVASIHWGGNWGYHIPRDQRAFAHGLIDVASVVVVHGHSSHHVKAIEIHRDKPILYGCGDFVNDYEGIRGHEEYRGYLSLMYFASIDPVTGRLEQLRITPFQMRRFRLNRASRNDARWLREMLARESHAFGTRVESSADASLDLAWSPAPP